jgi:hypothetical protein
MASKTLRQAEKKALEGTNESQDTLVVAHCLMAAYGIGLVSVASAILGDLPGLPELTFWHCAAKQLTTSRSPKASSFATQAKHAAKRKRRWEW